jgi:tRNA-dihydrouridine synthase
MIGRAAIGYPWIFREIKHYLKTGQLLPPPSVEERVAVCRKHLQEAAGWQNQRVAINEMRGRYASYLKGLPNIKEYRNKLVRLNTPEEVNAVLDEILQAYAGYEIPHTPIELIDYHEKCPL